MTTKADLVWNISVLLEVDPPRMSTGSTEPREIFDLVNETLGLGLDGTLTKPDLARGIVEAAGMPWEVDCESRGGTVTLSGLQAVERSVRFLLGQ
ncbi:MAG TPA: hypothetical protein VN108_02480 [Marmoricola sp.]|nr:hypothetical protein [Marmoricola sp.]